MNNPGGHPRKGAAALPVFLYRRIIRSRRLNGDRHGHRRAASCGVPSLQPHEPLLELAHKPFRLLASGRRCVGPLGQGVEQLEDGIVEDALVCRKRLDVPAHELPQHTLDECLRAAAGIALGRDRPEALGQRAHRGELGVPAAAVDRA